MRRHFILIILCLAAILPDTVIAKNQGKELTDLLLSYMKLEDVHPDSLERNIDSLKQCRLQTADKGSQAVYAAAIARLYAERIYWRSVGNNMRDSMITWYGRALADKQILVQTKAKRWKPFVVVGKDESYFGGDMLNVVWRSMVADVEKSVRDTSCILPKFGEMIDFYRQKGMREGAMLLALDSLDDKRERATEAELIALRDQYADLPICAEIYLRLGTMVEEPSSYRRSQENDLTGINQNAQRSRKWLQEGLTKYPKYKRRAALQNALTRLSDPFFEWNGAVCVSPNKEYRWVFSVRNVQSVLINGEEVRTFPEHDPIETFRDSMIWTSPKPGRYKLTFLPHTNAKLTEKVKPLEHWVQVTTLQPVYQVMPDSSVRVLVVDPETGHPQPNVTVTAYKPTNEWKDTVAYFVGRTGRDGKVSIPHYKGDKYRDWRYQLTHKICSPDTADWTLGTQYFYNISRWEGAPKKPVYRTELFTDRAIYRPGQTVHVSGIDFSQLDWNAEVSGKGRNTLYFYDSNHKLIEERMVESDEMGVFSADLIIPTGKRNGVFSIEVNKKARTYFRVEEYKRPTFEVVLDDSLYIKGDSCEVRGTARNYDGSPLRGARVTGTYYWRTPWIYFGKRFPQNETLQLDTIETDDSGRFAYKLKNKNEKLKIETSRSSLSITVDVLSQQGETHNAQHWYWRIREPKPEPNVVKEDYTFLVRCVSDSFDVNRPAQIEIITNQSDVCLFYTLSAAGKVWEDEMVRINKGTFMLNIPYRKEYDQSLTASFCFVKEGRIYTETKTIYLIQPDNRLQYHWDTFRDLVQPGQKEEWRLTLRRLDGTPADANVMLTMYDASLDYFARHKWHFDWGRGHRTFGVPFQTSQRISLGLLNFGGWYSQKTKKERELSFTNIDDNFFQAPVFTRGMRLGSLPLSKNMSIRVAGTAPMEAMAYDGLIADNALEGRIAGLTMKEAVVEEESADDSAEEETLSVPMRENFNETAFFMPQLRTNENGQVVIAFTLPESLTRWNLMGIAHTSDMMYANISEQIEARKDLMAQLYLPRFLRPGDEAVLTASVRNVSDQRQQGKGMMQILDAKTEKVLKQWKTSISLEAQHDTVLHFTYGPLQLPLGGEDILVRWRVEGTTCSDGEQRLLPILSPTEHITNTIPITVYNPGVTNMDLSTLFPDGMTDRQLTVEYTTNPEQYALQALPALAKAKHEDVLSIAAAYYAGELGKALKVEMPDSTAEYLAKLQALQDADGGFRWYPSMPTSPYLTREVSYLLTRLHMLTGKNPAQQVNTKAVRYLLSQRIDSTYFSYRDLRSLYVALRSDVKLTKEEQKKVDFLLRLAKKAEPEEMGYEGQALLALVWNKAGEQKKAKKCIELFKKYVVSSPERGSYIEFPKGSFVSIDRKLHIHVQMMEAVKTVMPEETNLLAGMRRYLLQQKRTQEWSTPVNSANAIFALMFGREEQKQTSLKDLLTLTTVRGNKVNFIPKEGKLGYLRDSMEVEDKSLPKSLRVHKFSNDESWGAVFADFEQPFEQVTAHSEGLTIRQEYPQTAKTGNRYKVRYYLSADRDYEYVTLIVPRPAFTEPVDMRSGYRWGSGLGYYRQVHDATTEFSFCRIPRGEYLIEETLYVERDGKYHSGIAVIRCEYADEFQGHSADAIVKSEK